MNTTNCHSRKVGFFFLLLWGVLPFVLTQEIENDTNLFYHESLEVPEDNSDSIFKYAWDFPNYGDDERYSFARRFTFFELNGAGVGYVGYSYGQVNADDVVAQGIFAFMAFRPFIFDFKSFDISLGVSFAGTTENQVIADVNVDESEGGNTLKAVADSIEGHSSGYVLALNAVFNFPDQALQIETSIGHGWSHFDLAIDIDFDVNIQDVLLINGSLDEFEFNQRDQAFFFSFMVRKFYDRDFLNYFSAGGQVFMSYTTYSRNSRGIPNLELEILGEKINLIDGQKQKLPPELDIQGGKKVDINSFAVGCDVRLFTLPSDLPIPGIGNRGFDFDVLAGLEHRTGEAFGRDIHGLRVSLGGYVSILGMFNIIYAYTWEESNDLNDDWSISVVIGLYGSAGVSLPSPLPLVQPNPGNVGG